MNLKQKIMQSETFIFDMDGTIVNLEHLNFSGYKDAIESETRLRFKFNDYKRYFAGTRISEAFKSYLKQNDLEASKKLIEKLIKNFQTGKRELLKNDAQRHVALITGAKEFIQKCKKRGNKCILATSTIKEFTNYILQAVKAYKLFDFIITAEAVKNGKPDPEIFNLAIEKTNADKKKCTVFEDCKMVLRQL